MDWRRVRDFALLLLILIFLWVLILLATMELAKVLIAALHHFVKAWNGH